MVPLLYMQCVTDRNIIMWHMTVMSKKVMYKIYSQNKIPYTIKIKSEIIKMSHAAHLLYRTIIIYQHNHQTHGCICLFSVQV